MDTLHCFSVIFEKGDNFGDLLFAFPYIGPLLSIFSPFTADPFSEGIKNFDRVVSLGSAPIIYNLFYVLSFSPQRVQPDILLLSI